MKRLLIALLAIGTIAAAAPAFAGEAKLAEIIFGKSYNDGVTAIRVTGASQYDQPLPLSVKHPMASTIRQAQSTVSGNPQLMRAISDRRIALHNVIEVVTALNGGHVIYYR